MKFLLLRQLVPVFLFGAVFLVQPAAQAQTDKSIVALLKESKWQKRVLLLYAPTADNADLLRQQQLLEADRPGLAAREITVREVVASQLSAADRTYVQQRLAVSGATFVLLLIGKDGGVKRRETEPISAKSLFSTIDVMPMRQQEMRRPK